MIFEGGKTSQRTERVKLRVLRSERRERGSSFGSTNQCEFHARPFIGAPNVESTSVLRTDHFSNAIHWANSARSFKIPSAKFHLKWARLSSRFFLEPCGGESADRKFLLNKNGY